MEEEARQILRQALLRQRASVGLGSRIAQRFTAMGGVDLPDYVVADRQWDNFLRVVWQKTLITD
jgi:hypothetical protein